MLSDWLLEEEEILYAACLNPCFNGICSLTQETVDGWAQRPICLNPCFNGICSLTVLRDTMKILLTAVLILVLMEYAL